MADKVYADGIWGNEPRMDAPDFVKGSIAIQVGKFVEWLNQQEGDARGYVRLDVTRQRANPEKWSFALNTYQPKSEARESVKPGWDPESEDSGSLPF